MSDDGYPKYESHSPFTAPEPRDSVPTYSSCSEMTVAELFHISPLSASLRKRVVQNPYFEQFNIREIARTPWSLEQFLTECRALPQCGEKQISVIRAIVSNFLLSDACPDNANEQASEVKVHYSFTDSLEDVFLKCWRESYLHEFFYLPSTLPEFFKCRPILEAELPADVCLPNYMEKITLIGSASGFLEKRLAGTVLLDFAAFEAVFERRHRYANIRTADLEIQKEQLLAMCASFPGIDFQIVDFTKHGISSGWVANHMSVVHAMGGYLVFSDVDYSSKLFTKCRNAATAGTSLTSILLEM